MFPHSKEGKKISRDALSLQRLLRKTENLQHCPFPANNSRPQRLGLTSLPATVNKKNAELCKAPGSASPPLQPQFLPAQPLEPRQPPRSRSVLSEAGLGFPWKTAPRLPEGWSGAEGAREGGLMRDRPASRLGNGRDSRETQRNAEIVSDGLDPKGNNESFQTSGWSWGS